MILGFNLEAGRLDLMITYATKLESKMESLERIWKRRYLICKSLNPLANVLNISSSMYLQCRRLFLACGHCRSESTPSMSKHSSMGNELATRHVTIAGQRSISQLVSSRTFSDLTDISGGSTGRRENSSSDLLSRKSPSQISGPTKS